MGFFFGGVGSFGIWHVVCIGIGVSMKLWRFCLFDVYGAVSLRYPSFYFRLALFQLGNVIFDLFPVSGGIFLVVFHKF